MAVADADDDAAARAVLAPTVRHREDDVSAACGPSDVDLEYVLAICDVTKSGSIQRCEADKTAAVWRRLASDQRIIRNRCPLPYTQPDGSSRRSSTHGMGRGGRFDVYDVHGTGTLDVLQLGTLLADLNGGVPVPKAQVEVPSLA